MPILSTFAHRPSTAGGAIRHLPMALAILLLTVPAIAVINPRYTPADLVKGSAQILALQVTPPGNGSMTATIREVLHGKATETGVLRFGVSADMQRAVSEAFGGQKSVEAMMFLVEQQGGEDRSAILIESMWFAIDRSDDGMQLVPDEDKFFEVWAGNAARLEGAVRYVQADPFADFPVAADATWIAEQDLGVLPGPAAECRELDLGGQLGRCLLTIGPAGDRLFRLGSDKTVDVTGEAGLHTASRHAAIGDFTGDGLLDLALADDTKVTILAQRPDGTFAPPAPIADVEGCHSLDCVAIAGPDGQPGAGLLVGTDEGPRSLARGKNGAWILGDAPAAPAGLGPADRCLAVDVTGDGRWDAVAFHEHGLVIYPGTATGPFGDPLTVPAIPVTAVTAVVCGDYDADGHLDLVAGGAGGVALLGRIGKASVWRDLTFATGELIYHGNQSRPRVVSLAPCDLNGDGRQGIALVYAARKPLIFFNRGFGCFGWARDLEPKPGGGQGGFFEDQEEEDAVALQSIGALDAGASAGTVLDADGDGMPDLAAVITETHRLWIVRSARADGSSSRVLVLRSALPGPRTVTVRTGKRITGMVVVRPGMPVSVSRERPGPALLCGSPPTARCRSSG